MALSRRDFLIRTGLLAGFTPAFLAACSSGKSSDGETAGSGGDSSSAAGGAKLAIAAWPLYLEDDQNPRNSPTIKSFTAATGIDVDYQIAIDDNVSFTAKYEGDLKSGNNIGFDIVQPTAWMAAKWISNGWVEALPVDKIPNKVNLIDSLTNLPYDPDRSKSMPYSIIQTGIAYYPEKVGFEITSVKDLFKPELKGKVTILSEMRDSVGFMLLSMGVSPAEATLEEMIRATEELKKLRDAGQFRKITGNGYIEDLGNGDTAAAMAWSGDVGGVQADNPDLRWAVPVEGGMLSSDTLLIPKGGNVDAAAAWINHLYDPKVSGPLFEAISYMSPVKGAGDNMTSVAKANSLVNPPSSVKLIPFKNLTDDEAAKVDDAFVAATQQ